MALWLSAAVVRAEVDWREPQADLRVVVGVEERSRYADVTLPSMFETGRPVGAVRAWLDDQTLQTRVVWRDDQTLQVRVRLERARDRDREFTLYALPGDAPIAMDHALFDDDDPVAVSVWRLRGQDRPDTLDRMQWALARVRRPAARFRLPKFMPVDGSRDAEPHWVPERSRGGIEFLARMSAAMRFSQPRAGRFLLKTDRPTIIRVDGAVVVDSTMDPDADGWRGGPPLTLGPGIAQIEVLQSCEAEIELELRLWWTEAEAPEPLEGNWLVRESAPLQSRLERIDHVLHPAFTAAPLPVYRFAGRDVDFQPWRFENTSVSFLAEAIETHWGDPDSPLATGESFEHVFTGPPPHQMQLRVVDSLGFRAQATCDLNGAVVPESEYLLVAQWQGLPAAAWPTDRLRPRLWVRTTAPPELPIEAHFGIEDRTGERRTWTEPVGFSQGVALMDLPEIETADLHRLWASLRHAGVEIRRVEAECSHPPFARLPDGINGDSLLADGRQWILAPRHQAIPETPRMPALRGRRVVWIEDAARDADPTALAESREAFARALVERLSPAELTLVPFADPAADARGAFGIRELPRLGRFADADVAVLALGESAAQWALPPAQFARLLGAVAGLLTEVLGLELVLATPLPGADPARMRPYAEAMHGVADAYGLAVLDRFTFVMARQDRQALSLGGRLTATGISQLTTWIASRCDD